MRAKPSVLKHHQVEVNLRTFRLQHPPTAFRPHFSTIANTQYAEASFLYTHHHHHHTRHHRHRHRAGASPCLLLTACCLLLAVLCRSCLFRAFRLLQESS